MGLSYPPLATLATTVPDTITPGASPYTFTNSLSTDVDIIVSGGTVTAIDFSRDGVTFLLCGLLGGMYRLNPGDRLRVTYAVVPTMKRIFR
jgi:hypothetical protein